MRRMFLRVITAIQLTRLTVAFGAVSDVWFVILLTHHAGENRYPHSEVVHLPLVLALFAGAVVAVGLFAYGASLNDVLDVRHDATFSPDRPIPAGRIRIGQAIVVTVGALIIAVLAAGWLGPWPLRMSLITAAGVLFYNATGKYIPAAGVITIGLIHAAHMLIPNYQLEFLLPVWLILTHSMVIAALVHMYEDKRPKIRPRALAAMLMGWIFWSGLLFGVGALRGDPIWPDDLGVLQAVYPLVAVIGFAIVGWIKATRVQGKASAEKLKRYGAMWQSLYGAAWLLALGLNVQAMWIGLFALAGFTAMTLIKEITGLSGRPIAFRA